MTKPGLDDADVRDANRSHIQQSASPMIEPAGVPLTRHDGTVVVHPGGQSAGLPPSLAARLLTLVWALLPLAFGMPAGPCFAWAAWRLRSRTLAIEATLYLGATVAFIALAGEKGTPLVVGAWLGVVTALVGCTRGFLVRRQILKTPADSAATAAGAATWSTATVDRGWTPVFPAQTLREQGHSAASPFVCGGRDRHALSMPLGPAAGVGLAGALLIALDLHLHLYGRGLGAGIGLILGALLAPLFTRWVDGDVLYYRNWGKLHRLELASVTAVTASRARSGGTTVLLAAPTRTKPLAVSLQRRGYVMPTPAREHLQGWLSAPHVQWTPEAKAAFDDDGSRRTSARPRRRLLMLALSVALPVAGIGAGASLVVLHEPSLAISGAPGYSTFTGPHGKPLLVGRPWGRACQPIRFAVDPRISNGLYAEIATVVYQARRQGVDVALDTRASTWFPSSLYYQDGQSPATAAQVAILANSGVPPTLANGQPEHINLGWSTHLDGDGQHEDLTFVQGELWLRALDGHPRAVRRSIRQLIAMTQGIMGVSRHNSAIPDGSKIDEFTPADLAAMKRMSGCSDVATTA